MAQNGLPKQVLEYVLYDGLSFQIKYCKSFYYNNLFKSSIYCSLGSNDSDLCHAVAELT